MTILEWVRTIALIGAFILSIALYIFALMKAIREGFTRRWIALMVFALGALFILYLSYYVREIAPADWAQILILLGLVAVTGMYALSARKQADASMEMAKEMKEQRFTMSQPLVFPDFTNVKFPEQRVVLFRNLGNGPALNITITFAYANADIVQHEWSERTGPSYSKMTIVDNSYWTIIEASKEIHCEPYLAECNQGNIGTAFIEYSDIYGRRFLAGWEYRCEKDSKGRIIMQPTKPIYPITREGAER